jgi:hypothetical protein
MSALPPIADIIYRHCNYVWHRWGLTFTQEIAAIRYNSILSRFAVLGYTSDAYFINGRYHSFYEAEFI